MDRKMNEYPQRDEYRTSIEGDDNDPVGTMEKRDEQFMERIENDKDEVHRPRGNKAGNGLENKDDEEEWIV